MVEREGELDAWDLMTEHGRHLTAGRNGMLPVTKYYLSDEGVLLHVTGSNESAVMCHKQCSSPCSANCSAFQMGKDDNGKDVVVLHCFPEPRDIDIEKETRPYTFRGLMYGTGVPETRSPVTGTWLPTQEAISQATRMFSQRPSEPEIPSPRGRTIPGQERPRDSEGNNQGTNGGG